MSEKVKSDREENKDGEKRNECKTPSNSKMTIIELFEKEKKEFILK